MVEPMDMLTVRTHEAVYFAGPARTGKTQAFIDCFTGYVIMCEPADMAIVQISQEKAKDFSKLRINYMLRHSPELAAEQSHRKQDDNVHEKFFKAGNVLKIIWPTVNQLSSSEFRYILLTDYDRMPQDVDHEGSPFSLAQKRTQTYLSRGMAAAESSPGYEIEDAKWSPRTPHEAPPAPGILSLYNQGDRRRWYMRCPHCGEYFMPAPGIEAFLYKHNRDLFGHTDPIITSDVKLICTVNGCEIEADHKYRMNAGGIWVPEGCHIEREGKAYGLAGEPRNTKEASFWLPGAAAAYQTWESIVHRYLTALRE
jgi:phage terminase large subunit GpA-like protein